MIERVMRGSVRMLVQQGWDGVKFDSCSMFHNLTRWAELINEVRTCLCVCMGGVESIRVARRLQRCSMMLPFE